MRLSAFTQNARIGLDRSFAGGEDAAQRGVFLLLVGDRRVDVEREAAQKRGRRIGGAMRASASIASIRS